MVTASRMWGSGGFIHILPNTRCLRASQREVTPPVSHEQRAGGVTPNTDNQSVGRPMLQLSYSALSPLTSQLCPFYVSKISAKSAAVSAAEMHPIAPPGVRISIGDATQNFSQKRKELNMNSIKQAEADVARLKDSLEALLQRYSELSRAAAEESLGGAQIAKQARSLADMKAEISVTRSALNLAQQKLAEASEAANEADAIASREKICGLTSELLKQAKRFEASIKKAGKEYGQIIKTLNECKALGQTAKNWPREVFQHQKPYHWAYNHFINLSALHLGLTPSLHFTQWPKAEAAKNGADPTIAYSNLIHAKNLWQNPDSPEEEVPVEPIEWREATPEEINNVA